MLCSQRREAVNCGFQDHSFDMPHRAEFDKIEWLLIRVLHTLTIERSISPAAMRLNSKHPAARAERKRLREQVRDVASNLCSHAMPRRRGVRTA